MTSPMSRRAFLQRTGFVGCSLAASPLITPVTFAATPWEARLVVIILRGGMDGLDVVRPYGDPALRDLRPGLGGGPDRGAHDLDGFYALHPTLEPLMRMWGKGQLGFVQAVSTPYRDKRSHFDGQDLLEAGTDTLAGVRDGWLNRMLQAVPGLTAQTAYAIGRSDMRLLQGRADVANWSPEAELGLSPQAQRLMDLVTERDPAIHAAWQEAQLLASLEEEAAVASGKQRKGAHERIADFAAERLNDEARIAAFSLNGWDTHKAQRNALPRALTQLSETLITLRKRMARDVWDKTAIVAMTEFGRTARENGSGGTDHGTGGMMVLAGGAVRGGRVHGDWPGLQSGDLYQNRDLMPTRDVRAHVAWIMRSLMGLDRATLEGSVFPGLDMGNNPGLLL
ncbi:DUF1501 domain-containing protein [uncultured Tateyamaria sp.]|uniref:DUF1501 domain-containing protein n=1 Tax=Tateyamaria sp. 1078 TaxID=3417464 RepID=UPI00262D2E81|nr:DUF1501 domain-containing protein [uncultured Tateyamaria sp.]